MSLPSGKFPDSLDIFRLSGKFPNRLENFRIIWKVSRYSGKFPDNLDPEKSLNMPKVSRQSSNILDGEPTYELGTLFLPWKWFPHTILLQKWFTHTFLSQKRFMHTSMSWKQFTHTFLSQNDFLTLFCRESGLRTFYCECFLRTLFCHKKIYSFFVTKTIYALRLESFCLLKFAIPKAQTFLASAIHIQQYLLNKAKKFLLYVDCMDNDMYALTCPAVKKT